MRVLRSLCITSLFVYASLFSPESKAEDANIEIRYAVNERGEATGEWVDNKLALNEKNKNHAKKLTPAELNWAKLIQSRTQVWESQLEHIAVPFQTINRPKKITLVLGNEGGRDAFTLTSMFPNKIYFNLSVLSNSYKNANTEKNRNRIDRIFAHEYTHLLQHRWSEKNPFPLTNHFNLALNEAYKEGFGHFRSISKKWKDENGLITEHGEKALSRLEAVFVERMSLLITASNVEAQEYLKGLSTGPFHKKWGALTVALWLTKEANGQDKNLVQWVNWGPEGVLMLADKYLPINLKNKLNQSLKSRNINRSTRTTLKRCMPINGESELQLSQRYVVRMNILDSQ